MRYAMAIDVKRCVGCHTCAVACKTANNLPKDIWWNRILTTGGEQPDTAAGAFPNTNMAYLPITCQHCENPPCIEVCPVRATYKREADGIVIQDAEKCTGCRQCIEACPYSGVRQFSAQEPGYYLDFAIGDADAPLHKCKTVSKCTFCIHRLVKGKVPACMELCIGRCRYFGDLDDPDSDVSKAVKGRKYYHLLDAKGTKPSIFYLT